MNIQPLQAAAMTITHQRRTAPDIDGPADPDQWMADALCSQIGGDEWFPDKGGSTREAKSVCNGAGERPPCPVRTQCLTYALEHDERHGVWGGLSRRERLSLARRRAVA